MQTVQNPFEKVLNQWNNFHQNFPTKNFSVSGAQCTMKIRYAPICSTDAAAAGSQQKSVCPLFSILLLSRSQLGCLNGAPAYSICGALHTFVAVPYRHGAAVLSARRKE